MAKSKTPKGQENELGIAARDLSVAQRRELFLKKKKELSKDWRVVQANQEETLIPFDLIAFDHGLRLEGLARSGAVHQLHRDEGSSRDDLHRWIWLSCARTKKLSAPSPQKGPSLRRLLG